MGAQKPGKNNNAGGGGGANASSIGSDSSPIIKFEAMFETIDVDPDGKKFDRVSRFVCRSTPYGDAEVTVDVNVDVYPIRSRDEVYVRSRVHADTDGSPEDPTAFDQTPGKKAWETDANHVTHGSVTKRQNRTTMPTRAKRQRRISLSGGLLTCLKTDAKAMSEVDVDDRVYCLMRERREAKDNSDDGVKRQQQ